MPGYAETPKLGNVNKCVKGCCTLLRNDNALWQNPLNMPFVKNAPKEYFRILANLFTIKYA